MARASRRPQPSGREAAAERPLSGHSRAARRLRDQLRQIAPTRAAVLLEGEAGTGKSFVARAIHQASPRHAYRFVWVNAAAHAPGLLETELFGAPDDPAGGAFARAHRGTLFLEAVDQLSGNLQSALLHALQGGPYPPAGGGRGDVRVIAATELDLEQEVGAGRFRADLFYALAVVRVAVPPLRERREDIPVLAAGVLRELAREHGRRARRLTGGAVEALAAHDWPGNVGELKSVLEGMMVAAPGRGPLEVSALPARLRGGERAARRLEIEVGMTLEEAERALVEATLRRLQGDKPRAAAMLGIGLRTLYRKLPRGARR